ncbi:MAG: oligosaccharide flippase family protein [Priestia megaterium]
MIPKIEDSSKLNISLLIKQILSYVPGTLIPMLLLLLSTYIFTRVFSSTQYGQYALWLSICTLLTAVSSQWLQQSITRYLSVEQDNNQIKELKTTIFFSFILIFLLILLSTIFYYLFFDRNNQINNAIFDVIALFILLGSLYNSLGVILQAEMKVKEYSRVRVLDGILKFICSLIIVLFIWKHPLSILIGSIISYTFLIPLLWKMTNIPSIRELFNYRQKIFQILRMFFIYGMPMVGWFLCSILLNFSDRYIISFYRDASEVGIYSASYSLISGAVSVVTTPILFAAHPFMMKAWEQKDDLRTGKWIEIIMQLFILLGVLLVGLVALFSKEIAHLFLGEEFRDGATIMPIVLAGLILWQMSMYSHKPFEFTNKTTFMLKVSILTVVINCILNFILVPFGGYKIAAITTFISYLFYYLYTSFKGKNIIEWKFNLKEISHPLIFLVLCFLVLGTIKFYLAQVFLTRLSLIVTAIGSATAVFIFLLLFKRNILPTLKNNNFK